MGEVRKVYKVLVEKPKGKRPLEDQGVDGRMGLEWILGRLAGGGGLLVVFDWLRMGTGGELFCMR
jgi:hypothetical protein